LTLLEILVSLSVLALVVVANSAVVRALGLLGVAQFSDSRFERPARLRTLAMEYIQAELEYLRSYPYDYFRDEAACNPTNGLSTPLAPARRVPTAYLNAREPRLPAPFAAADIIIESEAVVSPGTPPEDCRPRRVTLQVYLISADVPATPGGAGGVIFSRGATVRAP
jgi:hypothetical protein